MFEINPELLPKFRGVQGAPLGPPLGLALGPPLGPPLGPAESLGPSGAPGKSIKYLKPDHVYLQDFVFYVRGLQKREDELQWSPHRSPPPFEFTKILPSKKTWAPARG